MLRTLPSATDEEWYFPKRPYNTLAKTFTDLGSNPLSTDLIGL